MTPGSVVSRPDPVGSTLCLRARRRRVRLVGVTLLSAFVLFAEPPTRARAGDFWDEVRQPGITAFRMHVRRAQAAIGARQFEQALEASEVAVRIMPERAEGHAVRGIALAERNRADDAAVAVARALDLDPGAYDDALLGTRAAHLMARSGHPALAARVLRRLLMRMPPTSGRRSLFTLQGDVLQQIGSESLPESVRAYREAMRTGLRDSRSLLGLALALRRMGEREEADVHARAAIEPGSLDNLISRIPVSNTERAARRALAAEAAGDVAAANAAWAEARADPVWGEWAAAQVRAARATPRRRRPRRAER